MEFCERRSPHFPVINLPVFIFFTAAGERGEAAKVNHESNESERQNDDRKMVDRNMGGHDFHLPFEHLPFKHLFVIIPSGSGVQAVACRQVGPPVPHFDKF
jgi:hypothetical protein